MGAFIYSVGPLLHIRGQISSRKPSHRLFFPSIAPSHRALHAAVGGRIAFCSTLHWQDL